jgi:hypothetical protein
MAFWSSLPGVLTGVAGVLAAAATLGALFVGGDDDAPSGVPAAAGPEVSSVPGPAALDDCFSEYFEGIPAGRLGTVEAGAYDDVLEANEPKAGPLGMTFTDFGQPIGGMRFAFFPENSFFKIESVVDASCNAVEDYENPLGGDKHNWQDSQVVRIRLGDRFYDATAAGGGSIVRFSLTNVAP